MRVFSFCLLGLVLVLTGCAKDVRRQQSSWDAYYARTDKPRAYVVVMPPQGSTVPMSKLIAQYVAQQLAKHKISTVVGNDRNRLKKGNYFILNGVIEKNTKASRYRAPRIIRWNLSDSHGRLIASHAEGVTSTKKEWNYGSARLLNAIGISTAGPIAEMVLAETKATIPLDPMRWGLMVERVNGLEDADAKILTDAVRQALRAKDLRVTGDLRQATFRLAGDVEILPQPDGVDNVRLVWRVLTMGRVELGRAVQENKWPHGEINNDWSRLAPTVAKAMALGIQQVLGARSSSLGVGKKDLGTPPEIVLPGVPGRAPAPPQ